MAAARVQRWAVFLAGYNYPIRHIPGKDNVSADCLSRFPTNYNSKKLTNDIDEHTFLNFIINDIRVLLVEIVKDEIEKDRELSVVKNIF